MTKARFHLTFPERLISEPVIYRVGERFHLITNIRRANVEERSAWVILEVEGAEEDVARAEEWLVEQGLRVNRIDGS